MRLPSSRSFVRCVVLSSIVAAAAACSAAGSGDDSASTAQASTGGDLFDGFVTKFGAAYPSYTAIAREPAASTIQYSAIYVPNEKTAPNFTLNPLENPMLYSLVSMIDNTPAGAEIRMAHFQFELQVVYDALVRALDRGVVVVLVKADNGDNKTTSLAAQLLKKTQASNAPTGSNVITCENGAAEGNPGACIGIHLMHNKFVLFSSLCKNGLTAAGKCVGGDFYGGVSAQMSVNLQASNLYNFNTLTVFGGDNVREDSTKPPAFNALYDAYRSYFADLVSNSKTGKSPASYYDPVSLTAPGSTSEFEGFPIFPEGSHTDKLVAGLQGVTCLDDGSTTVYITSNLWTYEDAPGRRDLEMMQAVKQLNDNKCKLVIAGASSMNPKSPSFLHDPYNKATELWAAAHEIKEMNLGPDGFRFFKVDTAPAHVTLHAKLIIVDQPAGNKKGLKNELMFGSLTMENEAIWNDQVWLHINDPASSTYNLYKTAFLDMFSHLSGRGTDIPNSDPSQTDAGN